VVRGPEKGGKRKEPSSWLGEKLMKDEKVIGT